MRSFDHGSYVSLPKYQPKGLTSAQVKLIACSHMKISAAKISTEMGAIPGLLLRSLN